MKMMGDFSWYASQNSYINMKLWSNIVCVCLYNAELSTDKNTASGLTNMPTACVHYALRKWDNNRKGLNNNYKLLYLLCVSGVELEQLSQYSDKATGCMTRVHFLAWVIMGYGIFF